MSVVLVGMKIPNFSSSLKENYFLQKYLKNHVSSLKYAIIPNANSPVKAFLRSFQEFPFPKSKPTEYHHFSSNFSTIFCQKYLKNFLHFPDLLLWYSPLL